MGKKAKTYLAAAPPGQQGDKRMTDFSIEFPTLERGDLVFFHRFEPAIFDSVVTHPTMNMVCFRESEDDDLPWMDEESFITEVDRELTTQVKELLSE